MRQHCLFVLGMHRSGTSAAAGALALLGVDFGDSLLPPSPDNPKGYWEHSGVVDVHQRLLEKLGTTWYRPMPTGDWWSSSEVKPFRDELIELVADSFGDAPLWGVKDPRMSRLVPLWKPVVAAVGAEAHYLLVHRHPAAVAASLARRDGLEARESHLLWLEHTLDAEAETRGESRDAIDYDQLVADPLAKLRRIGDELGLRWPRDPLEVGAELESFLSPVTRHLTGAEVSDESLPPWVRSVWNHRPIGGMRLSAGARSALTRMRTTLGETLSYLRPWTALEERALAETSRHAANLELRVADLQANLDGHLAHVSTLELELKGLRAHASNLEKSLEELQLACDRSEGARGFDEELRQDRDALDRRLAEVSDDLVDLRRRSRHEARRAEARERERDVFIEGQARLLAESDEQVAYGHHVLADREQKIEGLESAIEYLGHEIDHRDAAIIGRDAEIAARDSVIAARDLGIARLEGEIDAMSTSRSWRITRPLRWLSSRLARRRHGATQAPEDRSHQA